MTRLAIQGALFGAERLLRQPLPAGACAHHGIPQCEDCRERDLEGASAVAEWDSYVADAPTFADAQDRMEEAVNAGVDFGALLKAQGERGEVL